MLADLTNGDKLDTHLKPLILSGKAIRASSFCVVHQKHCRIDNQVAMMHIAGTPCTAHSAMGLRDQEKALAFAHFLCWCGQRRLIQEPIVVQECVDTFPRSVFHELLDMYDWCFDVLSPVQYAWPVTRTRQWAVPLGAAQSFSFILHLSLSCQIVSGTPLSEQLRGRHKAKTLGFRSLLHNFAPMFYESCVADWSIFFWESGT